MAHTHHRFHYPLIHPLSIKLIDNMETTTDISTAPGFAGLTSLLAIESRNLHLEDIEADIEGEKETLPDFVDTEQPGSSSSSATLSISQIEKTIAGYSKGVSDGTENEYHRSVNF